eukprot:scaffold10580_cov124-Skeletonema_menzelii.AAC.1
MERGWYGDVAESSHHRACPTSAQKSRAQRSPSSHLLYSSNIHFTEDATPNLDIDDDDDDDDLEEDDCDGDDDMMMTAIRNNNQKTEESCVKSYAPSKSISNMRRAKPSQH